MGRGGGQGPLGPPPLDPRLELHGDYASMVSQIGKMLALCVFRPSINEFAASWDRTLKFTRRTNTILFHSLISLKCKSTAFQIK